MSDLRKHISRAISILLLISGAHVGAAVPTEDLTVDPTAPLQQSGNGNAATNTDQNAGYLLNSILVRGDVRVAVINSQRVRVGDSIGQATVTNITDDSVTLNVVGRVEVLQLRKSTIRTPIDSGG